MSINIQGKPLKEWVEEQKKKDGVMIVHRGTTYNGYTKSTYNGAIVTLMDGKDVCYEDADISMRINGKEYRLTGRRVERIDGVWYIDGTKADLPKQEQKEHMADTIQEVEKKVSDALNESAKDMFEVFGIANIDCHMGNSEVGELPAASISRMIIQVVRPSFMALVPEPLQQVSVQSSKAAQSTLTVVERLTPLRVTQ